MPNRPATGSFNWDASLKKVIAPYFGGPTGGYLFCGNKVRPLITVNS